MRLHVLQHVPFEGPAMIADWAKARGYSISITRLYEEGVRIPEPELYDALIIIGGPMGVYDEEYLWLAEEKQQIRTAIEVGKHVLGICLGAQLIANVLGANVAPHRCEEIGWFPVVILDEAVGHPMLSGLNTAMEVLHWHGDRFEIPEGALSLMRSEACDNQAFLYKERVLGVQFHLEMDEVAMERIIEACGGKLEPSETVHTPDQMREKANIPAAQRALYQLLDNWIAA